MHAPAALVRATTLRRLVFGVAVACAAAVLGFGGPVVAHTDFSGSDPADGDVLDEPVAQIVLDFTAESTEAGDGFVVLDADGQLRRPSSVTTDDNKTFILQFDPALSGGTIGVRWSVRAGDAHPIEGSFSFTAGDSAPPSTQGTTPDSASETTAPDTGVESGGDTATDEPAASPSTTDEPAASPPTTAVDDIDLAAFLDVDDSVPGEGTASVGRTVTLLATVIALGGLAVAFAALRGPAGEIGWLLRAVRITGVVLAVGATIEYVGVARIAGDALSSAWTSSAGAATVMRAAAGIAIAVGIAATTVGVRPRTAKPLSAAVDLDAGPASAADRRGDAGTQATARWVPDRRSAVGFAGAALLVASFWLDGHTVTEGVRPLHAAANSVHVVAGSIWAGGVITMAALMSRRRRQNRPRGALELLVRFSSMATVALGAVVVAGLVMAAMIADSFSDLTTTEWGKTLLLKTAAAGVAMAFGAWNHFRLLPALESRPDDAGLQQSARATVTAEAIVLAFVVVATASLVAAAV